MESERHILEESDRKAWRSWLSKHASSASEIWLVVQRKHSRYSGIFLDDAVEEALCYGWIDSTLNRRDDHSYLLRFSPRKPDSVWSMNNIRRVNKLEREGRMRKAGRDVVRAAKESGQWQAAIDRENPDWIPPQLEIALQQVEGALEGYQKLSHSKKKQLAHWFESAKRQETKQKRIVEIVRMALERLS
jgi:uncharacterized protein YdeI (YjbR/CyaY-like superfamily)